MTNEIPLINGKAYDWASITIELFGFLVKGVSAIKYKRKQEKVDNYGSGTEPVSRGYGKVSYEGSITLDQIEINRIQNAIPDGQSLSDISPFSVTVVYQVGTKLRTDKLKNVEFMEQGVDTKSGDTNIEGEIPIMIAGINFGR